MRGVGQRKANRRSIPQPKVATRSSQYRIFRVSLRLCYGQALWFDSGGRAQASHAAVARQGHQGLSPPPLAKTTAKAPKTTETMPPVVLRCVVGGHTEKTRAVARPARLDNVATGGRKVLRTSKIPSPAPNSRKNLILRDNQKTVPPNSMVLQIAETTSRVVVTGRCSRKGAGGGGATSLLLDGSQTKGAAAAYPTPYSAPMPVLAGGRTWRDSLC